MSEILNLVQIINSCS